MWNPAVSVHSNEISLIDSGVQSLRDVPLHPDVSTINLHCNQISRIGESKVAYDNTRPNLQSKFPLPSELLSAMQMNSHLDSQPFPTGTELQEKILELFQNSFGATVVSNGKTLVPPTAMICISMNSD